MRTVEKDPQKLPSTSGTFGKWGESESAILYQPDIVGADISESPTVHNSFRREG